MSNARLQALLAMANAAAEEAAIDMSEVSKGGGRLYPEGYAMARFVRYVEFGMQPQEFNGKAKAPALEFRMGFALFGEGYQNEDGSPGFISTFDMSLSNNEKAGAKKIFDKMNWKGTHKHFAQMLNEAFLVKIINKGSKTKPNELRSRLSLVDTLPPFDAVSKAPYPVPEVPEETLELFLWTHPTKEAWDALHIEGVNDSGKSKNFLQEKMLAAVDFPGSPLEQLLRGSVPSPEALAEAPSTPATPQAPVAPTTAPAAPDVPWVTPPAAPAVPSVPAAPTPPPVPAAPVAPAVPAVPSVPVAPVPPVPQA